MPDQEEMYVAYRNKLCNDARLKAMVTEAYQDTASDVDAYVGKGTVFCMCLCAFAAGFLLASYYMVEPHPGWYNVLLSCLTFGGFLACAIIGAVLYAKFKRALTRKIYFSYVEKSVIHRYLCINNLEHYEDQLNDDYHFSKALYEWVT